METRFTLREWMALPEGFPAQLFDGQLVREPSPTYGHQDLAGHLYLQPEVTRGFIDSITSRPQTAGVVTVTPREMEVLQLSRRRIARVQVRRAAEGPEVEGAP